MGARAAEPVIKIQVAEGRIEIIAPEQVNHTAAKPDAFGITGRAGQCPRCLRDLVDLFLGFLGCVGGRFLRLGRLAVTALLIAAPLGIVSAVDMPVKTKALPPPAFDWNGFYIGAYACAAWMDQANTTDPRWGNVEISVYDLASGKVENTVLHPHLEQDDHDAPAFLVRKDGRYLAVYSKHTKERRMYYRISEPHNPQAWGPAMVAETPGTDAPVQGNNATYANLFRMPGGRLYNFIRAFGDIW